MRIQGNTLFGVFRREFILVGDLIATLGRIKPAVEQIAGAHGVINFSIIFGAADTARALDRLCAFVIEIQRNLDRISFPDCIQFHDCIILLCQVVDCLAGGVLAIGRTVPPTGEGIAVASKTVCR